MVPLRKMVDVTSEGSGINRIAGHENQARQERSLPRKECARAVFALETGQFREISRILFRVRAGKCGWALS
jgi:hypothetical protein